MAHQQLSRQQPGGLHANPHGVSRSERPGTERAPLPRQAPHVPTRGCRDGVTRHPHRARRQPLWPAGPRSFAGSGSRFRYLHLTPKGFPDLGAEDRASASVVRVARGTLKEWTPSRQTTSSLSRARARRSTASFSTHRVTQKWWSRSWMASVDRCSAPYTRTHCRSEPRPARTIRHCACLCAGLRRRPAARPAAQVPPARDGPASRARRRTAPPADRASRPAAAAGAQPPTISANSGRSRNAARSSSSRARSAIAGFSSTARRRCARAASIRPARLSKQAVL